MKTLKFIKAFTVVLTGCFFIFSTNSCKKDNESVADNTVAQDQLLGKWNMVTVLPGGTVEKDQVTLKTNGVMEMDIEPQDGKVDFILGWDVSNNVFSAHLDLNGVSNVWMLHAQVDPKDLLVAGKKTMVGGNGSVALLFGMEKQ